MCNINYQKIRFDHALHGLGAPVTQSVECGSYEPEVAGSSPAGSSKHLLLRCFALTFEPLH